jgi:tripartite-type tricarboxylate transporter receptor subunit TctC
MPTRRLLLLGAATLAAPAVQAQTAGRPIRLVVPFPPGGGADALGRPLSERLAQRLGRPVVIENRSGAGSNIGSEFVARAAPDGTTLLLNFDTLVLHPLLYQGMTFEPIRDLLPVARVASSPLLLGCHPGVPAADVAALVALSRADPNRLNFANPGFGSPHHLAFEFFAQASGLQAAHIAYRGGGPALTDVLAGHVQLGMFTLGAVSQHVRSGSLRGLAVVADRRVEVIGAVPTMAEAGFPEAAVPLRFMLFAPAGTPRDAVARVEAEVQAALAEPALLEVLQRAGFDPGFQRGEDTAAELPRLHTIWARALRSANIQPQ